MSIWNKGKDAGNKTWEQTKKAGNIAWTATKDAHVSTYNKGVSGTKWVGNKVKFW